MNLVKIYEKKPRESILQAKFANAIDFINKDLSEKNNLKFLHWDLNKDARIARIALERIACVAARALDLTGFFYCKGVANSGNDELLDWSSFDDRNWDPAGKEVYDTKIAVEDLVGEVRNNISSAGRCQIRKPLMFQHGVLRTNCIDCLDRTNVAQYGYGLVALGYQLHALGLMDVSTIDMDSPLAENVMKVYEEMGDTLARQYGGSPAHKKIFSERRGQWRAATTSQEFFRTLQRYYSNVYMDGEKQDSINVFLGLFQPQRGKPALWELDSDQYNVGRHISDFAGETSWFMKRSLSDGNILFKSISPAEDGNDEQNQNFDLKCDKKCLAECTPKFSTSEGDISYTGHSPSMACRKLIPVLEPDPDSDGGYFDERGDSLAYSNFLDFDWLFFSGNSIGDETYDFARQSNGERSSSAYASVSGFKAKERSASGVDVSAGQSSEQYSERFSDWVHHGSLISF